MKTKAPDQQAASIRFGVEIETYIPNGSGVVVGHYHAGTPVTRGLVPTNPMLETIEAPHFRGTFWKAERDGSIRATAGHTPCEFVSPILEGDEGIAALVRFIEFATALGAKVNDSCGLHITVGIDSVGGEYLSNERLGEVARLIARHSKEHEWAIYGQTGSPRHLNHYSHRLEALHDRNIDQLPDLGRAEDLARFCNAARGAGRGMVNLSKLGSHRVIEFRAFAGTLNKWKVLHHLATVLALCRKAVSTKRTPCFKVESRIALDSAPGALRRFWHLMRWDHRRQTTRKPVEEPAFGLFGMLYEHREAMAKEAMRMAEKFEERFPQALTNKVPATATA